MMLVRKTDKTGWFGLATVVFVTVVAIWYIGKAFAEPTVEWSRWNEVRAAEIKALTE